MRRYRCRACGKSFSTSTFRFSYQQKKPFLNEPIFKYYVSGVSQRRLARNLQTTRKTIARKFLLLGQWARKTHEEKLPHFREENLQLDEMESYEHTRLKPLSIAMVVSSTAKILDLQVGTLNYKGRLASFAFSKYGPRKDTSEDALKRTFESISKNGIEAPSITTDSKSSYASLIQSHFPKANHIPVLVPKISMTQRLFSKGRRNQNDPLFTLNYTAAKIRHDLSRMARKVWVTTKLPQFLQTHLDLYIAYVNDYPLPL